MAQTPLERLSEVAGNEDSLDSKLDLPRIYHRRRIAIISLLPDVGHLTPLLQLGVRMREQGASVRAVVPTEACALVRSFGIESELIGPVVPTAGRSSLADLSNATQVSRLLRSEARFRFQYMLPLKINGLQRVDDVIKQVEKQGPDLLLADMHLFAQDYRHIARATGVPLVLHYSKGTHFDRQNRPIWAFSPALAQVRDQTLRRVGSFLSYKFQRLWNPEELSHRRRLLQRVHELRAGYVATEERTEQLRITAGLAPLEKRHLGHRIATWEDIQCVGSLSPTYSWTGHNALRSWLDNEQQASIVYISFGTMAALPGKLLQALFSATLKQGNRVLVAAKEDPWPPGLLWPPGQVRWEKWVPQTAFLSHRQVIGFVTHAGATSVQEALWFGKPMLCIPKLWDQYYSAWVVEKLGAGIWPRLPARMIWGVQRHVWRLIYDQSIRHRAEELSRELRSENGDIAALGAIASVLSDQPACSTSNDTL